MYLFEMTDFSYFESSESSPRSSKGFIVLFVLSKVMNNFIFELLIALFIMC